MHDDSLLCVLADRSHLGVARRVPLPLMAAVAAAPDYRWVRDEHGYLNRADLATVRAATRIENFDAEIELTPWTETSTELVVRPTARAPHRWSARRRRRWYTGAHSAADALRADLLAGRADRPPDDAVAEHRPRKAG
ncbi:MAG: hypothetical protein SGJ13_12865 [Actinomycetota bacterium]|nr:hypothetical protein [Actinomycetota bacterium]